PAGNAALEPQHVPPEARANGLATSSAFGKRLNAGLDLRHQLAATDLPERAVLLRRGAPGKGPSRLGKACGIVADLFGDPPRPCFGRRPCSLVAALGLDEYVRDFEQIRRAEAVLVGFIVTAAFVLAGRRRLHALLKQEPH